MPSPGFAHPFAEKYKRRTSRAPPSSSDASSDACAARDLATETDRFDELFVTFQIFALQVVEQRAALTNHLQQAATAVVIFVVAFEVLGEVRNALREQCNLHFRRTSVAFVLTELRNRFLFANGRY